LDAEAVGLRDLAREAHAARAQDAALVVEDDALGEVVVLGRLHLGVARDRGLAVVAVVVVLQRALARLVADAAIDRVVERDELQHLLAPRTYALGVGADAHALGDRHVAGDVEPAGGRAVALDLADATVAGHRQGRMPAEVRDLVAAGARRLHHGLAGLGLDPVAVDPD